MLDKGKVVLITGGARGIGAVIAREFAKHGAVVYVCDVNSPEVSNPGVKFLNQDLSQYGAAQKLIDIVVRDAGRLDALVNNARSGGKAGFLNESEEQWAQTLSVTLNAAHFATQHAVRKMAESGGGSIVNICSVASVLACHESPSYHAAKAALLQMTKYSALHAGQFGVRVNAVLPGFIVQDVHRNKFDSADNERYRSVANYCHPLGRVGESSEVADAVIFLCSKSAKFITGQALVIDGGLSIQDPSTLALRLSSDLDKSKVEKK